MAKAGAARVFFDVVGQLQSEKLLGDTRAAMVVQEAIVIDTMGGIADAFADMSSFILAGTQQVIDAFFEFEEQFVRVRKFYNATKGEVEDFAEAAQKMGHAFAFTGAESLAAAARTAQLKNVLGSTNAVVEATRQGLMMAQVGEMDTELGMNRFIALAQQTGFLLGGMTKAQYDALDAEKQANIVRESSLHVLNQLNTVENSSVATMEDITFVLNQFASQADIAGESIGEMAAMSALLLETGEEVSRAGTGLRMIYQRLGNANNEATKAIAALIPELDAQGVAQLKLSDVIKKIGPAYEAMGAAEKRALAVSIAGSRHYIKFLKIMENQPRLIELQTDAFHALYPAIEEFENKAESATFKSTQMEAKINDMKVAIGEDLRMAYMTSYRAQEMFLDGVSALLEMPGAESAVGGLIAISNVYAETVQPLTEVGLGIAGIVIAMKAFRAASPEMISNTRRQALAFHNLAEARAVEDLMGEQRITNLKGERGSINRATQSMLMSTIAQRRSTEAKAADIGVRRRSTFAQREELFLQIQNTEDTKKNALALKNLNAQYGKKTRLLSGLEKAQARQMTAIRLVRKEEELMRDVSSIVSSQKKGRLIIDERSITNMFKQHSAQEALTNGMESHANVMANELVLMGELDKGLVKSLQKKSENILLDMEDERATIAGLNTKRAELLARGQSTEAIDIEIQTRRGNILSLNQENTEIQKTLLANKQYIESKKTASVANAKMSVQVKEATKQFFTQGAAVQSLKMGFMGMSMILPIIVEDERQMSAMTYAVSVAMVTQLIPAMIAVNAKLVSMGVAAGFASGGLTVLLGAIGAAAAYAGFELFDDAFGEKLRSDVDDIAALNSELDTTASILKDLQGPSGEGEILPGLIDTTYNELKQNADLTVSTYKDITDRIAGLRENQLAAEEQGSSDLASMYGDRIKELETVAVKVKSIGDAQKLVNGTIVENKDELDGMLELLTIDEQTEYFGGKKRQTFRVGFDLDESGKIYGKDEQVAYFIAASEDEKDIQKARNEAYQAYLDERNSMSIDFNNEDHQFMIEYYTNLLKVDEDANAQLIENQRQMYDTLAQDQEEFANAREELFFGERSNFTGAIYKQITQGGVESVLHRVEFIQTNNFNGMVLEEMVEQVSRGVVDELRSLGVPV